MSKIPTRLPGPNGQSIPVMVFPIVSTGHLSLADYDLVESRSPMNWRRYNHASQSLEVHVIPTRLERWHLDLTPEAQKLITAFRDAGFERICFDSEIGEIVQGFHLFTD